MAEGSLVEATGRQDNRKCGALGCCALEGGKPMSIPL